MKEELRFDQGEVVGKAYRTDAGFLKVPAAVTKCGILRYRDRNTGKIVRELRHPREVRKAASLQTLGGVPMTSWSHPPRQLDLENVSAHSKGHLAEDIREDGDLITGTLVVLDKRTIEAAEKKELTDVSAGYRCQIKEGPGEYLGQPYDREQVNIRYNHVSLLPPGRGRAGMDVGLRMDEADGDIPWAYEVRADDVDESSVEPTPPKKENKMDTMEIRVDGVDCTVEKTAAAVIEKHLGAVEQRADSAETKVEEATKELETLKGERDQMKERLDALDAEAAKVADQTLANSVKELAPEIKLDGLSGREIQEALVKGKSKNDPSDWSDDYLQGRFDSLCEDIKKGKKGLATGRKSLPTDEIKTDSKEKRETASDARAEMIQRNREAHRTPTK